MIFYLNCLHYGKPDYEVPTIPLDILTQRYNKDTLDAVPAVSQYFVVFLTTAV